MSFIELSNLSFCYPKSNTPVFADVRLSLDAASTTAIVGPSGCGKSTLLGVIGTLRRATTGQYIYDGQDISRYSDARRTEFRGNEVGFVFQDFKLIPHLNVLDNVLLPVEHLESGGSNWRTRAEELLNSVGMSDYLRSFPTQLSGGQAQKVAIARSLMRRPKLLLADEPTGSLDDESALNILAILKRLAAQGTTLIMVTHSREMAREMQQTFALGNHGLHPE
jgi:putative ABC transport system ATP-binding protein